MEPPQQHSELATLEALFDICFPQDEFDLFIKNRNTTSAQYITSGHKKVARLLKRSVFKFLISADSFSNTQIIKSCFVDKIKHVGTNKAYKICRLLVQAWNDKKKDLELIQLPTI